MKAPKLAIGDGAMGFWAAMDEVFPETRHQRCWQHKTMNVLNCLPKLSQPKAKAAIHDIWQAETKADAQKAFDLFIKTYEPKGVAVPAKRPQGAHGILRLSCSALAEHPNQ
jgi:putative transposase